ncbi:terminase gpA endonuclease subunit [Thalassococcus sp. BH17M4-6]|uniref:terminase gpA endonuclease subunit n=1 Tax=Thalassococcus sp. BH17M4-6 TaxID=3413148 RepID=UPI003BD387E3
MVACWPCVSSVFLNIAEDHFSGGGPGSKTKTGARLWIVGVDTAKGQIFARLARGGSIRLSSDLPRVWHEQVASERAVLRYRRGQPVRSFERIPGRRAEALDCLVYAMAARQIIRPDWDARRQELATQDAPRAKAGPVLKSSWMER